MAEAIVRILSDALDAARAFAGSDPMASQPEKDRRPNGRFAKKLADLTREGDALMSRELATALMMLAAAYWIIAAGDGSCSRRAIWFAAA